MTTKRQRRKSADVGNETQRYLTLGMSLVRANAMSEATLAARPHAPKTKAEDYRAMAEEVTEVKVGAWARWFTFVSLYYATIQVLVETVVRTKISNQAIDDLLANADMSERLREYRHAVLHGGGPNEPPVLTFVSDLKAADEWCNALRTECGNLVRAHFEQPDVRARRDQLVAAAQARLQGI